MIRWSTPKNVKPVEPNTSSAVLVGPSLVCGDCFVIMNYGKNYIKAARATAGGGVMP